MRHRWGFDMPGHRFFQVFSPQEKKIVLKDQDEFFHLSRVLRLKAGDAVELVNGQGAVVDGVIGALAKSSAEILVRDVQFVPRSSAGKVTLACAIPKKAKFETIIEKCTELGVDEIVPLLTERTDVVLDQGRSGKKAERFFRVAVNASKQCKRLWFPDISEPVSFDQALSGFTAAGVRVFIPWLEGPRISLREAMSRVDAASHVVFFIGPEGDFSPREIAQATDCGAVPVSLGENVLKVDTAAMAVVAFARSML